MPKKNEKVRSSHKEPRCNIILTPYELELLQGKNPYLERLYIGLRRLICFHCGIVGIEWHLNMQYMIDWLTVDSDYGQKEVIPTHQNIQRYLGSLEGFDLIEEIIFPGLKRGKYYYYLKHAILDKKLPCLCKNTINKLLRNCSESVAKPLRIIHIPDGENCCENENYNQLKDKEVIDDEQGNCCEISTDLKDEKVETVAKLLRNCSESVASLILVTEVQNSELQKPLSLSSSKPPEAPVPSAKSSETQTPERGDFDLEEKPAEERRKATELMEYFNQSSGIEYELTQEVLKHIQKLLEGDSMEVLKAFVDIRVAGLKGTKNEQYLTPSNVFGHKLSLDYLPMAREKVSSAPVKIVIQALDPQCCYHRHHPDETEESKGFCEEKARPEDIEYYQKMFGMVVCRWHADMLRAKRKEIGARSWVAGELKRVHRERIALKVSILGLSGWILGMYLLWRPSSYS